MAQFDNRYSCLNCEHCFKIGALSLLSKKELITFDKVRMEATFKKGEVIYKQGTPLTHIVIIHSGLGKIYIEGANGKNLILTYTKKNNFNGGLGIFIDQRHYSSLMAVTDCEACFIEISAFKTALGNNTEFREAYLKEHSQRVLHHYNQFLLLTQKNMEGRMAESIIYLEDQIFNNGAIKNIPKQDLAELTAMTKESAIRVLKQFRDDGLIETDNQTINVLDKSALELIALHG